jgi:hypothetical protein
MRHRDYHNLIHMGRKAGLNTAELYRAMTTRPLDRQSGVTGQADCNGFVCGFAPGGRVEYRPVPRNG